MRYPEALKKYWAAWNLLPEPQTAWEAATWLLCAIGDANFLSGDYEAGRNNLSNAMHCPGAIGNPFLHLRLGQCQLELGNEGRAADELARAYMAEGHKIFEDQDPKYLAFLKSKLDPPPGGWPDEKKKSGGSHVNEWKISTQCTRAEKFSVIPWRISRRGWAILAVLQK